MEEVRLMESRKSARLQHDISEDHHLPMQYVHSLRSPDAKSPASYGMIDMPKSLPGNRFVIN